MGTARHDITIPPGLAWRWRVEMHDANGPILTPGWSGEFTIEQPGGTMRITSGKAAIGVLYSTLGNGYLHWLGSGAKIDEIRIYNRPLLSSEAVILTNK